MNEYYDPFVDPTDDYHCDKCWREEGVGVMLKDIEDDKKKCPKCGEIYRRWNYVMWRMFGRWKRSRAGRTWGMCGSLSWMWSELQLWRTELNGMEWFTYATKRL